MVDPHAMKEKALTGAKRFGIVAYLWVLLSLFELHEWMILTVQLGLRSRL